MKVTYQKICFIANQLTKAQELAKQLIKKYKNYSLEEADVMVVIGGDGFMLKVIHEYHPHQIPIYGINLGTVGFLMNQFNGKSNLLAKLTQAKMTVLNPLKMKATAISGKIYEVLAINEISLLRQTSQTAKINIVINGVERLTELVSDGILLATPAGSTAYNLSLHGPILPLDSNLLALTPISPYRPRRWRGALLPNDASITFNIINAKERLVSATADRYEVRNINQVDISVEKKYSYNLLFDPDHHLEERILEEQFVL